MKTIKITKAEFARHAIDKGVALVGAPWNKTMDEILQVIDQKGQGILMALGDSRDKVSGNAQNLKRHTSKGTISHLRMDKDYTVYKYGKFFLIRGEHEDGNNTTVIYA